ncbi:MAG: response regulator transcription factor [Desulfobacterota bacterium]|nr:response regulator transcription factor [Thermodesulfobacteriota bacterium]
MAPKKKILIIDDERDIVKALTLRLQSKGYRTVVAYDGAQGLFMAHKEKPHLIILDIRMPAGDGFSVVEKLKESKRMGRIPVIFLTGSPERNGEDRARELGVRYYIKKPYDPEELLDAVRRALEAPLETEGR